MDKQDTPPEKPRPNLKVVGGRDKRPQHDIKIEKLPIADLVPASRNARRHAKKQIKQLTASIEEFDFINPIIVDEGNSVLAGHARLEAAKAAGMQVVPVVRVTWLTDHQKRAYRIADNRIPEQATWDFPMLAEELKALSLPEIHFNLDSLGFEMGEIDVLINSHAPEATKDDEADHQPALDPERPIVSKPGELWRLGRHSLMCGNALDLDQLALLLDEKGADMVITDPPYNIPIDRFVCGLGSVTHEEFAMASGEMTPEAFRGFLRTTTTNLVEASRDGSIHYIFMDWRHLDDLLVAGREVYSELKSICVWNKTNGGMGSLYRSKHEFIAVFKRGEAPHINNINLGKHGRNRTTVWDYAGVNSFGEERDNLALHPTVKPVQMIEDAILDCSNRGDRILDVFCGSGTTLIAAERAGRVGFGMEIDPRYVDATLRRFRTLTGENPVRVDDGATLTSLD